MTETTFQLASLCPQMAALDRLHPFWPELPGFDLAALARSIEQYGLRRPLLAFESDDRLKLLAGARRREALLSLGRMEAPTLILPSNLSRKELLRLGLADQGDPRNPAETALIWNFLVHNEADSADDLSDLLGLKDSPKLRAWCLASATLPEYALKMLADGGLDLELAARLADWAEADRQALLRLFELLTPSKQKKKQWIDWLEDLARRDKRPPSQVLADEALEEALASAATRGRPAAESQARQLVWARRHPMLAEMVRRREARVKALGLPKAMRLDLDPSFEDLKYVFSLTFTNRGDFLHLLERLEKMKDQPDFVSLLDDGEDPIADGEYSDV